VVDPELCVSCLEQKSEQRCLRIKKNLSPLGLIFQFFGKRVIQTGLFHRSTTDYNQNFIVSVASCVMEQLSDECCKPNEMYRMCSWWPCWRSKTINAMYIKIKLFSQWKGILLFSSSSMAAVNTLYSIIVITMHHHAERINQFHCTLWDAQGANSK